jgi:hypothetical protein
MQGFGKINFFCLKDPNKSTKTDMILTRRQNGKPSNRQTVNAKKIILTRRQNEKPSNRHDKKMIFTRRQNEKPSNRQTVTAKIKTTMTVAVTV